MTLREKVLDALFKGLAQTWMTTDEVAKTLGYANGSGVLHMLQELAGEGYVERGFADDGVLQWRVQQAQTIAIEVGVLAQICDVLGVPLATEEGRKLPLRERVVMLLGEVQARRVVRLSRMLKPGSDA